ncbi:intracellular sulfur oxidation DsrE/DsrF family protein [Peptoniphilus olsenii]|uniref:Intracellular sulfur oxidation DsrE/DsrF family protein n=1 Tax=Peptoniphilus olsenii TaxID=411570 RepID=A0ABV2JE94_9FIRM
MKVIFHVVDKDKWDSVLSNVRDILATEPDCRIEIIAMSKAASLFSSYSGTDFSGIMGNPKVNITIGQKALEEHRLTPDMLPQGIQVEPLVITKIVKLQNEGYGYIRL